MSDIAMSDTIPSDVPHRHKKKRKKKRLQKVDEPGDNAELDHPLDISSHEDDMLLCDLKNNRKKNLYENYSDGSDQDSGVNDAQYVRNNHIRVKQSLGHSGSEEDISGSLGPHNNMPLNGHAKTMLERFPSSESLHSTDNNSCSDSEKSQCKTIEPQIDSKRNDCSVDNDSENCNSVTDVQTSDRMLTELPTIASSNAFLPSRARSPLSEANSGVDSSIADSTVSVLTQISTKEARDRSYLFGSLCSTGSILGPAELDRHFPQRRMRLFVGTWNMCGMRDVPKSIDNFLLPDNVDYLQDAYIIGSQESIPNRMEWELKLQETLGPYFVLFHSGTHGTLHVAIFLRRDLIWFCSVTEESTVTTRPGPSGIKTKGAIGVCFNFFGSSFLFINSHLTAHDGRMDERIDDYKKIISGLSLPRITNNKPYASTSADDATGRFDFVFWFGDLNCRLQMDRDRMEVLIKCSDQQTSYDEVVRHDELRRAIDEEMAFMNFHEGRIQFRPTYKYDVGTDDFDTSKKMRTPSYTDRILFRCRKKNSIVCLCYNSASEMKESDHKPVYGLFDVQLRPGVDTIPLSGGQFNREVWLQGCKKRVKAMSMGVARDQVFSSSVCSIM